MSDPCSGNAAAAGFPPLFPDSLDWGKVAPGPKLPAEVIERTSAKYLEAYEKLTGKSL